MVLWRRKRHFQVIFFCKLILKKFDLNYFNFKVCTGHTFIYTYNLCFVFWTHMKWNKLIWLPKTTKIMIKKYFLLFTISFTVNIVSYIAYHLRDYMFLLTYIFILLRFVKVSFQRTYIRLTHRSYSYVLIICQFSLQRSSYSSIINEHRQVFTA